MSKISKQLKEGFDKEDPEKKEKKKFRFDYDEKEQEFIEVEQNVLGDIGIIVGVVFAVGVGLAIIFKISYLTYLGSLSLYLFILGGIVLFFGSLNVCCQESPSLQYAAKRGKADQVKIKSSSDLKVYTLAAVTLIVLSFAMNYIGKFLNF